MIEISEEEYEDLIAARNFLSALEQAGVDNWDGYDYAREILNESNDE
jgi:hypothetical protein